MARRPKPPHVKSTRTGSGAVVRIARAERRLDKVEKRLTDAEVELVEINLDIRQLANIVHRSHRRYAAGLRLRRRRRLRRRPRR